MRGVHGLAARFLDVRSLVIPTVGGFADAPMSGTVGAPPLLVDRSDMAGDTEFHIQEQKKSYKDREWTYVQGDRRLAIYVEMGVFPHAPWAGVDSAFSAWTEPKGVALDPLEQRIVRERVETWARDRGQPVRFGPGVGIDALIAPALAKGWRPVRGVDSAGHETLRLRPPLRTRLRWLLARLWR